MQQSGARVAHLRSCQGEQDEKRCRPSPPRRFISDRELQLIKRYDKRDPSYQAKLLDEVGTAEERWLGGLGGKLKKCRTRQTLRNKLHGLGVALPCLRALGQLCAPHQGRACKLS